MIAPLEREANRLQKEFVLFAGHELKIPITIMRRQVWICLKEEESGKCLDYVAEENEKCVNW